MKKLILPIFVLCVFLATGLFESCTKENKESLYECNTDSVSYSADIHPIYAQSCGGDACHGERSSMPYFDYTTVRSSIENNSAICRIEGGGSGCGSLMPKGGPRLSDCQINTIKAWQTQNFRN